VRLRRSLRELVAVALLERELECVARDRYAVEAHEREQTIDFGPPTRPARESLGVGDDIAVFIEAHAASCGQQRDELVHVRSASVELDSEVERVSSSVGKEASGAGCVELALGHSGKPREFDELVDVGGEPRGECRRPWQSDQRDRRLWQRAAQRT